MTSERFGAHVRNLRRARSLTQEGLAERAELSTDAVRRIERGRLSPTLSTLTKLARGLEMNLSTIFAGLDQPGRRLVAEISDYLATRTPRERELVWRIVHRLFDD